MSTFQKMKEEWFGFRSLRYLITGHAKCAICDERIQTDGGFICGDCRSDFLDLSDLAEREARGALNRAKERGRE